MRRALVTAVGVLMTVVGAIWTLQGLGYLTGGRMTGSTVWAVVGPLVAGFGVALVIVAVRGPRDPTRP